jgi:hypothetical protein
MIYFTTFILTLLLSHIARATPACGDVTSPEELYDPTYTDTHDAQHALPIIVYNVTWANKYDNKNGDTKHTACPNLAHRYPHYKDFPHYPYIGGAWNIKKDSPYCGSCWNLTNLKTHKAIYIIPMDSAKPGYYNISKEAFNVLNGGKLGSSWLSAEARPVDAHHCHIKKKK